LSVHTSGGRFEHPRAVERAYERQVVPGAVGESGYETAVVADRVGGDRGHDPRRSDRDDHIALFGAEAERRGRVVTEASPEYRSATDVLVRRAEHGWQLRPATTRGQLEEVETVAVARGVVVTGAARVAAIGGQRGDLGVAA
jgi:hypothetical protein